jgi:hypothetical protein
MVTGALFIGGLSIAWLAASTNQVSWIAQPQSLAL